MTNRRPEVLAPAGSLDALAAAIAHGADAVYLGVGALNARVRAANIAVEQLPAVVAYAHSHKVKVHVALNVPVQPETLDEATRTLSAISLAGADAVILRDPILMELAHHECPALAVHASTQAGVCNAESAQRMRTLGCSRVILARECSLEEMRAIRQACPDLELESFFFGAQCFGISGACLLGEAVGQRSGNYGNCLQACRLPFVDESGTSLGYPFSMMDLDYLRRVKELVVAGVSSLKIEGRMKSPAWVGCVTAWSRRAADSWRRGGLTEGEYRIFDTEISSLFSRPRADAFLDGERTAEKLVHPDSPTHRGLPLPFRLKPERGRAYLLFEAPVEVSVRDGLLLQYESGEEEAVSIRELREGAGRGTSIVAAGQTAWVPAPSRRLKALALHSCQAVRRQYEVSSGELLKKVEGGSPPMVVSAVKLRTTSLTLEGTCGTFTHSVKYPLTTEPAREAGFGPASGERLFPAARFDCESGLFVSPSALKALRRRFRSEFADAYAAALTERTALVQKRAATMELRFLPTDAELLARGPAAVSRVTGLPAGSVATTGGDRFTIEAGTNGTVVRHQDKP